MCSGLSGGGKFIFKELNHGLGSTVPTDGLHGGCGREKRSQPAGEGPSGRAVCDRNIWTLIYPAGS